MILTAVNPQILVENIETQLINNPGMAGNIAVIGAFDSAVTDPVVFTKVGDAQAELGTDSSYNGCKVIDKLFVGAESLLCVNINVRTGSGENITNDKTLTPEKLTTALAKIKHEDFDCLFIAEELSDTILPVITTFLDDIYEIKNPAQYIGAITRANKSAYLTTVGLAGDYCAGLISQQLTVNNTELSLLESAAYYCGVIAGLPVGNSMTQKTVPNVTAVSPEYTFEDGDLGLELMQNGLTVFSCANRRDKEFVVHNSEQPSGLDLYMVRSRNYIIKQFRLREFLGDKTILATLDGIKQECKRIKEFCVEQLGLATDINYTVEKADANCVNIFIDSIVFAGVLTLIKMYIRVEVE